MVPRVLGIPVRLAHPIQNKALDAKALYLLVNNVPIVAYSSGLPDARHLGYPSEACARSGGVALRGAPPFVHRVLGTRAFNLSLSASECLQMPR
jgi:hypothetical protein